MHKFILIPDSFKGTMSSSEICAVMEAVIRRHVPDARVCGVPVADGGEGSVDAFLGAVGGEKVAARVQGPWGEQVDAFYGVLPGGVAVIEMAAAAGLPLVGERCSAERTTTYGVGQLMRLALERGCKKIIMGLGGSATNDGGCGAAAAMGAVFKDAGGEAFVPVGATLARIASIDLSGMPKELADVQIVAMCDIDNPLCGELGAAHVFGPQKGADPAMVELLDAGLAHMAGIVKKDLGRDILSLHGAGAAGGMGGGMVAYFGAQLQMGIETVLDTVGFDSLLDGADMVFSGEGKIDFQSLLGKVVIGVARRTKKAGVPLIAVVGDIGDNIDAAYEAGVSAIFSINRVAVPYQQARVRAKNDLALTMDNLMRFFARMGL